jgi:hypothetical protein
MLSAAKHLEAQCERPFAAAQGDTEGKHERDAILPEMNSQEAP